MIRIKSTGEFLSEGDFRRMHSSVPLPFELTQELIDPLDADIVYEVTMPIPGEYEYVALDGAAQGQDGKWYNNYVIKPAFVEFIDENGVVQTVEMQIAARVAELANCTCELCVQEEQNTPA